MAWCSKSFPVSIKITVNHVSHLTANTFRLPLSYRIQSHWPPAPGAYFTFGSKIQAQKGDFIHVSDSRWIENLLESTEASWSMRPRGSDYSRARPWRTIPQRESEECGSSGTHVLCVPCLLMRWPATWEQRIRTPTKSGCCLLSMAGAANPGTVQVSVLHACVPRRFIWARCYQHTRVFLSRQ